MKTLLQDGLQGDIPARVRNVLDNNGGYILAGTHALTPDIPVENMMAMIQAAKE